MQKTAEYITRVSGAVINARPVEDKGRLPLYLAESYDLYLADVFGTELMLAVVKPEADFSTGQLMKHSRAIKALYGRVVVMVVEEMTTITRRRLIHDRINFIVPDKYMFLPDLMVDFREQADETVRTREKETLLPSAQAVLFYHILNRTDEKNVENMPLKDLAGRLLYTPMAISNAVENLKLHGLCTTRGTKEKYISFTGNREELWKNSYHYLISPIQKILYADQLPKSIELPRAGEGALAEYSDLSDADSGSYAMSKNDYLRFKKANAFVNPNQFEGNFTLEVWKYDPMPLALGICSIYTVDPLSLYITLRDKQDERVEMALDQLIEKYIW